MTAGPLNGAPSVRPRPGHGNRDDRDSTCTRGSVGLVDDTEHVDRGKAGQQLAHARKLDSTRTLRIVRRQNSSDLRAPVPRPVDT
jgi:hypothetical protein